MATLQDAIEQIQATVLTTGVRFAPDFPPDNPPVGIFAICTANNGRFEYNPIGIMTGYHTLYLDILTKRADLPRDLKALEPYLKSIPKAIQADIDNRDISIFHDLQTISYITLNVAWGGMEFIGYRFQFEGIEIMDDEL